MKTKVKIVSNFTAITGHCMNGHLSGSCSSWVLSVVLLILLGLLLFKTHGNTPLVQSFLVSLSMFHTLEWQ